MQPLRATPPPEPAGPPEQPAGPRRHRPTVVWAAIGALGAAALGGLFTLGGQAWQLAELSAQDGGYGDLALPILGMVPIVLLVLSAMLLVAARRASGRGLAWLATAYSLAPLATVLAFSPFSSDYVTLSDPTGNVPTIISTIQLAGSTIVLIALPTASVLLALPDVRRYVLVQSAPPPDRRPGAVTGTAVAAGVGVVGYIVATAAYLLAVFLLPTDIGYEGLIAFVWLFVFFVLVIVTLFAMAAASFAVVGLRRRNWARRTTLLVAVLPVTAAAPTVFFSAVSATEPPVENDPGLVALFAGATVGSVLALVGFAAVIMLLSLPTVTRWMAVGGPRTGRAAH